jgi:hypothetical protein
MSNNQNFIAKYASLLPLGTSLSYTEAEKRAGEFLSAMAGIADRKHYLTNEKIKLLSVQSATYAQELSKGTAKTMTENKVTAEASSEYTKAREELESIDNDISYLRSYYEIFHDAHIFYRQVSKGINE